MAHRGGNIDITIQGDSEFNLDVMDFKVMVYPDRHPEEVITLAKSEMQKNEDNLYSGSIGYELTKELPLGMYTVEVLVIESETSRSVYVKAGAFSMYDSASKDIE